MSCHCLVKEEGFTLLEVIVVMSVFIIVLLISASAFNTVSTKSKDITKSEESNIEGVVGLEIFRHDLTQDKAGSDAGQFTSALVLVCVASMQVILGWNTSDSAGNDVDTYSKLDGSLPSGAVLSLPTLDTNYSRNCLKQFKVYILDQDGGFDPSFTNTNTAMVVGDAGLREATVTAPSVNLTGPDYQHYR